MDEFLWAKDLIEQDVFPGLDAKGFICSAECPEQGGGELRLRVSRDINDGRHQLTLRREFWLSEADGIPGALGHQCWLEVQDNTKPADHALNVMLRKLIPRHNHQGQHEELPGLYMQAFFGPAGEAAALYTQGAAMDPEMAADALNADAADRFFSIFDGSNERTKHVPQCIEEYIRDKGPLLERLVDVDLNTWRLVDDAWSKEQDAWLVLRTPEMDQWGSIQLDFKASGPVKAHLYTYQLGETTEIPLTEQQASTPGQTMAAVEHWMQNEGRPQVLKAGFFCLHSALPTLTQEVLALTDKELVLRLVTGNGPKMAVALDLEDGKVTGMRPPAKELLELLYISGVSPEHFGQYLRYFGNQLVQLAGELRERMPDLTMCHQGRAVTFVQARLSVAHEPQVFDVAKTGNARHIRPLPIRMKARPPTDIEAVAEKFGEDKLLDHPPRSEQMTLGSLTRPTSGQVLNAVLCREYAALRERERTAPGRKQRDTGR
ncbi:hypothetical protein [Ramlibacter alkalitolerans]|uniref:Uncharacterized protein n=1 Tax=Ramlibacter alkalitolerans TaxID=2039631 RepID=A0ABS1JU96_9BURK|nr:hypothetical protein [Ramlibacter alkalitolerans]MBL0427865.1 hypothetical protein [Ramlibacter alkalitolerans]